MVDLCPVFKYLNGSLKTGLKKSLFMFQNVTWLYHLNTRHPYCPVFRGSVLRWLLQWTSKSLLFRIQVFHTFRCLFYRLSLYTTFKSYHTFRLFWSDVDTFGQIIIFFILTNNFFVEEKLRFWLFHFYLVGFFTTGRSNFEKNEKKSHRNLLK